MPDQTSTNEIMPWAIEEGLLVTPSDMAQIILNLDNKIGELVDSLGGPNLMPVHSPVTLVPGSGMNVTVGGSGQWVIAQGRILDVCPAITIPISASGGSDRVDLIAIRANRTPGSTTISRVVRADNAPPILFPISGNLVSGTATVNLPSGYTSPPKVIGLSPVGVGPGTLSVVSVTTSQVIIGSSDDTDTRAFNATVYGNPTGSTGLPVTITYLEDQPLWAYVQGTSMTPPSPPSGYDAFAQIVVHASEFSIGSGDITLLFPQLISPVANLVITSLAVARNVTIGGTLNVSGATTLAALFAGAASFTGLSVSGNSTLASGTFSGTLGVSGATSLAALTATATTLATLFVSGTFVANGNLSVLGSSFLQALSAAATTLVSLHVTGNAQIDGALSTTGTISTTGSISTSSHFIGSGSGLTGIPNSALITTPIDTITSSDGSLTIPGGGVGPTVDITLTEGISGSTTSIPARAGIASFRKRFNYGTYESGISPGTDDSFAPIPSVLGAFVHIGIFMSGNTGAPDGQTFQAEFLIQVKPGSGNQTISGDFISNANTNLIQLDSTVILNTAATRTTQTWSVSVPDDSSTHILYLHFGVSGNSSPLNVEHAAWIPATASGGIDVSKFSYIGPTP